MLQYIKGGGRRGLVRSEVRVAASIAMRCDDASKPVERLVAAAAHRHTEEGPRLQSDRMAALVQGKYSDAAEASIAMHSLSKPVPVWTQQRATPHSKQVNERAAREGRESSGGNDASARHMTGSIAASASKHAAMQQDASSRSSMLHGERSQRDGRTHALAELVSGATVAREGRMGGAGHGLGGGLFGGLSLSRAAYRPLGLNAEQVEAAKEGTVDLQHVRSAG